MPKRILHELQIIELSAVDNPAQEGARCVLAKRNDPDPLTKVGGDPANSDDDDSNRGEGTMTDAEKLAKAEADKAAAEAKLAEEIAKGAVLAKVAALTDVEKAHYEGLKELDAEGAAKFLDMTKEARASEIEKAKNSDPVIYTDSEGHEYHKSEAKAASLAKRADELAKQNKELLAKEGDTAIEKRADELTHLKGEKAAKVALLKAVDKIEDEAQRTAVLEILKATDAGLGEALKTLGTKVGPKPTAPEAKLNKMAEDYATEKKISFAKAYDIVAQTPEGQAIYKEMYEATMPKVAAE